MNPFPANSIEDTENEPVSISEAPSSVRSVTATNNGTRGNNPTTSSSSRHPSNNNVNINNHSNSNNNNNIPQSTANSATEQQKPPHWWTPPPRALLQRESLAVLTWALAVPLCSLAVVRLHERAQCFDEWRQQEDARYLVSFLSWLLLQTLPSRLPQGRAPGSVLAHVALLRWVYHFWRVYPHWGIRVAEWRLGRVTLRQLAWVSVVHTAVPAVVWTALSLGAGLVESWSQRHAQEAALYQAATSSSAMGNATAAINFSFLMEDEQCWEEEDSQEAATRLEVTLYYFAMQVLVNALFPVAVLVLPSLLKLNDWASWWTVFLVYPLYNIAVGPDGRGSALSATVVLAQGSWVWTQLGAHVVGSGLGGLVMEHTFPDEPSPT